MTLPQRTTTNNLIAVMRLLLGSSSSSSSSASKAAFCKDNATLDKATASVTNANQLLQALKANQSTITDFGKVAPSAIKSDAEVLVSGANAAISANSAAHLTD